MDEVLQIGQVASLLDVSQDTLHYFDKEKIVSPKKARNGYRYYDDWDINFLIEYKRYRSFGFNVDESRQVLYDDSLKDLAIRMAENAHRIELEIRRAQMLLEYNQRYTRALQKIPEKIGRWQFTEMMAMDYFPMRYNNTYLCRPEINELFGRWVTHFPFVAPILIVDESSGSDYQCGLSMPHVYKDELNLPVNHLVRTIAKTTAINTVIVAGDRNTFSTRLLEPTYQYIANQGMRIVGPAIGYYMARVHEKKGYTRYIDVYIPVDSPIPNSEGAVSAISVPVSSGGC